jgi:hypothetical protein
LAAGEVHLRGGPSLFHTRLRLHAALDFRSHGDERLRWRVGRAERLHNKCAARARDGLTCSTLVEFFAEVSKKGISRESANSCKSRVKPALRLAAARRGAQETLANLGGGVVDNFFGGQVALVAYKHLVDFIAGNWSESRGKMRGKKCGGGAGEEAARAAPGISIDLRHPLLHVVERF